MHLFFYYMNAFKSVAYVSQGPCSKDPLHIAPLFLMCGVLCWELFGGVVFFSWASWVFFICSRDMFFYVAVPFCSLPAVLGCSCDF